MLSVTRMLYYHYITTLSTTFLFFLYIFILTKNAKEKPRRILALIYNAEDGVRRITKKVLWTFFPANRPTKPFGRGDLEPGFKGLLGLINHNQGASITLK